MEIEQRIVEAIEGLRNLRRGLEIGPRDSVTILRFEAWLSRLLPEGHPERDKYQDVEVSP